MDGQARLRGCVVANGGYELLSLLWVMLWGGAKCQVECRHKHAPGPASLRNRCARACAWSGRTGDGILATAKGSSHCQPSVSNEQAASGKSRERGNGSNREAMPKSWMNQEGTNNQHTQPVNDS